MRTCDKALAQFPDMLLRIGSAALGGGSRGGASAQTGDLESLSAAELYSWQHQRAHLMFEDGLPFSRVDSEKCRVFFCRISGSHFDGPGDRRRVGGPLLDLSSLDVGGRVAEKLREHDSVCLMVDGAADVNGKVAYNIMTCGPSPFLLSTVRVGIKTASSVNRLDPLKTVTCSYLLSLRRQAHMGRGPVARSPRLQGLAARVVWALCTDNASVMVLMRNRAEAEGLVLFPSRCFAQIINLIGKECCCLSDHVGVLRAVAEAMVIFRRYTRARAALQADRATHAAAGQ